MVATSQSSKCESSSKHTRLFLTSAIENRVKMGSRIWNDSQFAQSNADLNAACFSLVSSYEMTASIFDINFVFFNHA